MGIFPCISSCATTSRGQNTSTEVFMGKGDGRVFCACQYFHGINFITFSLYFNIVFKLFKE